MRWKLLNYFFRSHSYVQYARFFQPDETVIATVYAPIQFPPCSVLAFKEYEDSSVVSDRISSIQLDILIMILC